MQPTTRPIRGRPAFTLVEMVVACVLLTVLLAAVVSVWRGLLNESRQLEQTQANVLPESLARQLRRDVINARSYRFQGPQLELLGYVAQDFASGQPLLTLAIASYRIRPTVQGGLLLRAQQSLTPAPATTTPTSSQGSFVQPLWWGATAIHLTSNYLDTPDVSRLPAVSRQPPANNPMNEGGQWLELPAVVEVTLLGTQGQTLYRESIVREEGT